MPPLDSGALADPGIAGIHHLLEIEVREHPLRAGASRCRRCANRSKATSVMEYRRVLSRRCCAMPARCAPSGRDAPQQQPSLSRARTQRVRTTMAFYHDSGKADHARAVVAVGIQARGHPAQHRTRHQACKRSTPGGVELRAHAIADQTRGALHGLQRNIAREAVRHHDIDVAGEDIIPLDEANVVEIAGLPAARARPARPHGP